MTSCLVILLQITAKYLEFTKHDPLNRIFGNVLSQQLSLTNNLEDERLNYLYLNCIKLINVLISRFQKDTCKILLESVDIEAIVNTMSLIYLKEFRDRKIDSKVATYCEKETKRCTYYYCSLGKTPTHVKVLREIGLQIYIVVLKFSILFKDDPKLAILRKTNEVSLEDINKFEAEIRDLIVARQRLVQNETLSKETIYEKLKREKILYRKSTLKQQLGRHSESPINTQESTVHHKLVQEDGFSSSENSESEQVQKFSSMGETENSKEIDEKSENAEENGFSEKLGMKGNDDGEGEEEKEPEINTRALGPPLNKTLQLNKPEGIDNSSGLIDSPDESPGMGMLPDQTMNSNISPVLNKSIEIGKKLEIEKEKDKVVSEFGLDLKKVLTSKKESKHKKRASMLYRKLNSRKLINLQMKGQTPSHSRGNHFMDSRRALVPGEGNPSIKKLASMIRRKNSGYQPDNSPSRLRGLGGGSRRRSSFSKAARMSKFERVDLESQNSPKIDNSINLASGSDPRLIIKNLQSKSNQNTPSKQEEVKEGASASSDSSESDIIKNDLLRHKKSEEEEEEGGEEQNDSSKTNNKSKTMRDAIAEDNLKKFKELEILNTQERENTTERDNTQEIREKLLRLATFKNLKIFDTKDTAQNDQEFERVITKLFERLKVMMKIYNISEAQKYYSRNVDFLQLSYTSMFMQPSDLNFIKTTIFYITPQITFYLTKEMIHELRIEIAQYPSTMRKRMFLKNIIILIENLRAKQKLYSRRQVAFILRWVPTFRRLSYILVYIINLILVFFLDSTDPNNLEEIPLSLVPQISLVAFVIYLFLLMVSVSQRVLQADLEVKIFDGQLKMLTSKYEDYIDNHKIFVNNKHLWMKLEISAFSTLLRILNIPFLKYAYSMLSFQNMMVFLLCVFSFYGFSSKLYWMHYANLFITLITSGSIEGLVGLLNVKIMSLISYVLFVVIIIYSYTLVVYLVFHRKLKDPMYFSCESLTMCFLSTMYAGFIGKNGGIGDLLEEPSLGSEYFYPKHGVEFTFNILVRIFIPNLVLSKLETFWWFWVLR